MNLLRQLCPMLSNRAILVVSPPTALKPSPSLSLKHVLIQFRFGILEDLLHPSPFLVLESLTLPL
jgi:hypothetical protein